MRHHDRTQEVRAYVAERLDDADAVREGRRLAIQLRAERRRKTRATQPRRTMNTITRSRFLLLIVATLLVAAAGSASAGGLITGKRIKDGSLTGVDLRNNSVGGVDIKDGSLSEHDFDGTLVGQPGPQGPQGPEGDKGQQGPAGTTGLQYVYADKSVPKGITITWEVPCPPGKQAVGGGMSSTQPKAVRITESAPMNGGVGWSAGVYNASTTTIAAYGWAVCVSV